MKTDLITTGRIISRRVVRSEVPLVVHLMKLVVRVRPLELAEVDLPSLVILIVQVLLILGIPNGAVIPIRSIIRGVNLAMSRRNAKAQQSAKRYRRKKRLHWNTSSDRFGT